MLKCFFENGNENSLRHAVVDTVVIDGDKILLVKRTGKSLEGNKWALPGGYVERDETIKEAAAREVLEETGYQVKDITLLTIRDNPDRPKEDRQNISFVFIGQVDKKVGEFDGEIDDVQWFPLSGLPNEEEVAFDHYKNIELYKEYLEKKFSLPVW